MSINKRFLQLIAALWILVFHLWINLSGTQAEQFIIRIGYVGVEIFFFVSAWSLADKKIDYPDFLKNRFLSIYLRFVFFCLVAAVYKAWSVSKTLKAVFLVSFFESGGGSFLWFLPAIMLFYLTYPLFVRWSFKYKTVLVLALWFTLSIISEKLLGYNRVFIFTNRIPLMLCAYELKKRGLDGKLALAMLPVGLGLLYFRGFTTKLNVPFNEIYFVLAIPLVVSLAYLSGFVRESKLIKLLSSATLELYALQMIFGSAVVNALYKLTASKAATNLLMLVVMLTASVLLSSAYQWLRQRTAKLLPRQSSQHSI